MAVARPHKRQDGSATVVCLRRHRRQKMKRIFNTFAIILVSIFLSVLAVVILATMLLANIAITIRYINHLLKSLDSHRSPLFLAPFFPKACEAVVAKCVTIL